MLEWSLPLKQLRTTVKTISVNAPGQWVALADRGTLLLVNCAQPHAAPTKVSQPRRQVFEEWRSNEA